MDPDKLRADGNWLKQLKNILGVAGGTDGLAPGQRPSKQRRSTKSAVKELLASLEKGVKATKATTVDRSMTEDINKIVFNAVDLLINDKELTTKTGKTGRTVLERFKKEFENQSKASDVDASWKQKVKDALKALSIEQINLDAADAGSDLVDELGTSDPATVDCKALIAAKIQTLEAENLSLDAGRNGFQLLMRVGAGVSAGSQKPGALDPAMKGKLETAMQELMVAEFNKWTTHKNTTRDCGMSPEEMFRRPDIRKALKTANPLAGASVISALDPDVVETFDFDAEFGAKAPAIIASAVTAVARKRNPENLKNGEIDRQVHLDPKLFTVLKEKVPLADWNDPRQGLGTRVCQGLWAGGNYDQACEMIEYGVDTTLSTRAVSSADKAAGRGDGFYSGFVQALQHIVAKYLPAVDGLPKNETTPPDNLTKDELKIRGAKKIFDSLAAYKKANEKKADWNPDKICSLTSWDEVKNSELLAEFQKQPGTIWGFEDIRLPFVQAAHETQNGTNKAQPLRMMELWEVVEPALDPEKFDALIQDPEGVSKTLIEAALLKVTPDKFPGTKPEDLNELKKNFERDATSFLREYAARLPKASVLDGTQGDSVTALSGMDLSKQGAGIGCRAGLWWAKQQKQPVYYCLDGINMQDVIDYKTAKATSVQAYLDATAANQPATKHAETITMVEVREILKNWEELKDTIVFVNKGEVLEGQELEDSVTKWKSEMKKSDDKIRRFPAPPRAVFAKRLDGLDSKLQTRLEATAARKGKKTDPRDPRKKIDVDWSKEADMDARDIVKKSGYLIKIANTRRSIALRYIIDRCGVLEQYGLLSPDLKTAAKALKVVHDGGTGSLSKARKAVEAEIAKCNAEFRAPLTSALLRQQD